MTDKKRDYIPHGDDEFLDWSRNFIAQITANASVWSFPAAELGVLQAQFTDYEAKLVKAKSANRGSVDVSDKNAAKDLLEHTAREATKRFLAWNPAVTDAQHEALGITVHDQTRTTVPAPSTRPEFNLKAIDLMRIQVDFHDQESGHRAKPYGYSGAVFSYITESNAVNDYERLIHSLLMTHAPFTLELPPSARGKTLSGALQWQNEKGEKGPWSEIQSVIVP